MATLKDSKQAKVRVDYEGRVHKHFHGKSGQQRFDNEVRMLEFLAQQGCDFVPRVLHKDPAKRYLVTTNCGKPVDTISPEKVASLFAALEQYGVRHEDPEARNITYNPWQGRFNIIDFEFATFVATGEGLTLNDIEIPRGAMDELEELERKKREREMQVRPPQPPDSR